jgi:RNA polymerase sigma-70 factor (ECF subfamily)
VAADVPPAPSVEHSTIGNPPLSDRFDAFVLRHQDLVYGTAVRLLGHRSEAEDVAQAVFLKAFERFDQIGESPAAGAWLRTVTRNSCLNHLSRYRSRWRFFSELERPNTEAESGDDPAGDLAVDPAASALATLESAETHQRLEAALERLPDHQRVPIVLFHFEELSYEEIARTLGVALAKVKTDIHRGRLALSSALCGLWLLPLTVPLCSSLALLLFSVAVALCPLPYAFF